MLDSDASFFLVPEFQSSRGARRISSAPYPDLRFGAAHGADLDSALMPDPGTHWLAAPAARALFPASRVPDTGLALESGEIFSTLPPTGVESPLDFTTALPSDSLFLTQDAAPTGDLPPSEAAAPQDEAMPSPLPLAMASDARAVTPRRPMRFTFAREAAEQGRIALPVHNLFDGVFDADDLTGPDVDPRLQRSRARTRARLAAHEATLPPEARNLWCDAANEDDITTTTQTEATQDAPSPLTLTEPSATEASNGAAPRRAVRQLSVTRRTPRPRIDPAAIQDPLQTHLHQIRAALYTPDAEEEAATAAMAKATAQPLHLRVMALLLGLLLHHVLPRLRAAKARLALPRPSQTRPADHPLAAFLQSVAGQMSGCLRLPLRAAAISAVILFLAEAAPLDML